MNLRCKKWFGVVLVILFGFSVIIGFIIYVLNQNMDFFYILIEFVYGKEGKKLEIGQCLCIGGMVVEGLVKCDLNLLKVSFDLYDVGLSIIVIYDGILFDLF